MVIKESNITATYVTTRKIKEFTFTHTWTMFMKELNITATCVTTRKLKQVTFIHTRTMFFTCTHTWTMFMKEVNITATCVTTRKNSPSHTYALCSERVKYNCNLCIYKKGFTFTHT